MKRVGYIYEQMSDWSNIVDAEMTATKRKLRNPGVIRHVGIRIRNLCEIQRHVINCDMRTDEYIHEMRVSGQGKVRDIAKLHFHPSHIQHQLLVQCGERRAERAFIRHTYASRKGYGQIKCAYAIRKAISKYDPDKRWYCQMDIVKYYHNIPHAHIEQCLRRLYKDEKYIQAMLEPFHRFSADGKGVPLGIRPSQLIGNICLSGFDHFMTEENKCEDYIRYLDDTFYTGASKGEVRRKYKRAKKYLERLGFSLHEPKIHRICEGIDMMGFVMYGNNGDMWWRKSNKVKWLRSRAKVTNRKRLLELDAAAWGMLKHGNRHCRKLFYKVTGRRTGKKMTRIW